MPNFDKKAAGGGAEKRKSSRYSISPTFPLRAVLALIDKTVSVGSGPKVSLSRGRAHAWKDWPGTLVDLSATGANMHLNLAAVAFPEDPCRLKLSLGSYRLEIPCLVAHFVCFSQYAVCGLQFNFPDSESEKAFLQVLEPVIIGTSLVPIEPPTDNSGRHGERYAGKSSSLLTIWRQFPGGDVVSFDFKLNRYGVRWSVGMNELATYAADDGRLTGSRAPIKPTLKLKLRTNDRMDPISGAATLTEAQDEEVRWLFCLAIYNLSPSVAVDVRKFLLSLVVA